MPITMPIYPPRRPIHTTEGIVRRRYISAEALHILAYLEGATCYYDLTSDTRVFYRSRDTGAVEYSAATWFDEGWTLGPWIERLAECVPHYAQPLPIPSALPAEIHAEIIARIDAEAAQAI